jgi:D-hydroxyproline dehydrogenase subunit gamma
MREKIGLSLNGARIEVPAGATVAAALLLAGQSTFRRSVSGDARGPLCGMGICFECRVTINGVPHCRSCQILCTEGMTVRTE